jgi:hypothetical protein
MKKLIKTLTVLLSAFIIISMIFPDILDARGGFRGGGGFRSFGGSRPRSFSTPSRKPSVNQRSTNVPRSTTTQRQATSFGGKRLSSGNEYRSKYGTPRKTIPAGQTQGVPKNYVVHQYNGYGNGLMMGYLMGQSTWMWSMPFHGAFYYSRPQYVQNPDGTIEVYPPTFDWGRVFITVLIAGAIIYIIYIIIRNLRRRKNAGYSQSSFS